MIGSFLELFPLDHLELFLYSGLQLLTQLKVAILGQVPTTLKLVCCCMHRACHFIARRLTASVEVLMRAICRCFERIGGRLKE